MRDNTEALREALQRIVDWDESGYVLTADHIEQARAALAQQAATPAPAGWKLVPIEPTPEMIAAWPNGNHGAGHEASIYRAMLLAAPTATPSTGSQA